MRWEELVCCRWSLSDGRCLYEVGGACVRWEELV